MRLMLLQRSSPRSQPGSVETTHTHIPATIATHQPAPFVKTHHVAKPIFKNVPPYGTQQIT